MNVFHLRFSLVASVKVSLELLMQTCWWPLSDHWSVQPTSPHLSGFVFYGCLESLTELSALWADLLLGIIIIPIYISPYIYIYIYCSRFLLFVTVSHQDGSSLSPTSTLWHQKQKYWCINEARWNKTEGTFYELYCSFNRVFRAQQHSIICMPFMGHTSNTTAVHVSIEISS